MAFYFFKTDFYCLFELQLLLLWSVFNPLNVLVVALLHVARVLQSLPQMYILA